MEDLEEAMSLGREALALYVPGHPDRSLSLNNIAGALRTRYEQLGKMDDLEECVELNRDALTLRPPGHSLRPSSLNNLASALRVRSEQLQKIEDLEECIVLHREALTLRPAGHSLRASSLNNLANTLSTRYQQLGKIEDLEECISLNRDALILRPPGHPLRSMSFNNLSNAHAIRYHRLGKTEDLEQCISLNRDALALRPPGHPENSTSLNNLANALLIRYQRIKNSEDFQQVFTLYDQAANDPTSFLKDRLAAAIQWAQNARDHQHESMLRAYTSSLQLLQRSLISRSNVEEQHVFLATAQISRSLASDAASADGYNSPLEQLRQVEPDGGALADRLETLSAELERVVLLSDRTATSDKDTSVGGRSSESRMKKHRILSEEWEELVGKIREKPGLTHFLHTPPFDTLQSAAAEGPIILINVSRYRSDAIILLINNPPVLIPLPTIELADLDNQVNQLSSNQGIISALRYLWNSIASPVVTRLAELGVERKARIWWCPTGKLCALPLHAAGPYRLREPNLPDIYTSSYTSTLSSLIRARSNTFKLSGAPKLLVIGQPHETLQKVGDEVDIIKQYGDIVDVLLGAEASHEAVLQGLKRHSWVHFACHGHLGDDNQPFKASFELHNDHRLTLLELIQARLPNAECAFLAACHSAAGDSRTPDENIHLSAALQFCGFRSVVGTLWEMSDEDGPMMSREFYKYMFRDPERIDFRDSAYALSSAVREMRRARLPPERWVMFVHIGA